MKGNRRRYLAAVAGATLSVSAGCLTGDDTNGREESRSPLAERTLRYGSVLPMSGGLEQVGQTILNSAALPKIELEEASLSVDVEHEAVDSETSPSQGVEAARQLIDDGVPVIVGAAASDVTLQMVQRATIPASVVSCSPASSTPTLSIVNDRGYSFRTAPSDSLQAVVAAELAADEHGAETAATLYAMGDYGRQLSGAFSASFGGVIQNQVSFDPAAERYAEVLSTALADGPDVLFLIGYPESGIPLLETYYDEFAGDETVFVSDGLQNEAVAAELGDRLTAYGVAPNSSGPGQSAFRSRYREEYGVEPGLFAANSYDAAATSLLANAVAGANDGQAIAGRMRDVTTGDGTEVLPGDLADGIELAGAGEPVRYRGASGEIEFDENGDGGSVEYEYFTFSGGEIEVVDELTPTGVSS
ncbi:ABC transporter substrate-binding protein [Natronobacterium gregoryi]|uniref:ABC transporter substrate-binding protein n=2 Tax=Natronobacterium gregoryi TaxID=44930 RepID=L0AET5_NATGS|nr:ABC transporter substrate-binding protein [Natronobacterium gregoryi]AFZ72428.1 ABC-type branched-chain amino acid transport system, periplasmic component [Natronobacterium gregoryi SP2]ELY64667.1 ABC transporter substrate-binding protein [Natronobacterium gregoryi SP2]PLK19250.1 ABC transporter substrate-binding protein [Natronobacterium gregoryi SP2]SFJ55843.1 ABC-type branched-chain amino acid transport system, substrate-binding protein [Natronobacterium gregoryi]